MSETPPSALESRIAGVVQRMDDNLQSREPGTIAQGAVLPLLQALDWDIFDPLTVVPNFKTGRDRADFALRDAKSGNPECLVEMYDTAHPSPTVVSRALRHASRAIAPLTVLTNGTNWHMYLGGDHADAGSSVFVLDLVAQAPAESASMLRFYLSRDRLRSGASRDAARARHAIPRAWQALVARADSLLVELVADEVRDIAGVRVTDEEIGKYLRRLEPRSPPGVPVGAPRPPPRPKGKRRVAS